MWRPFARKNSVLQLPLRQPLHMAVLPLAPSLSSVQHSSDRNPNNYLEASLLWMSKFAVLSFVCEWRGECRQARCQSCEKRFGTRAMLCAHFPCPCPPPLAHLQPLLSAHGCMPAMTWTSSLQSSSGSLSTPSEQTERREGKGRVGLLRRADD